MHIKRAKQEILDSIEAYLQKDEDGHYLIPSFRQRPILLMGPPGIGKTQIMEQIARKCGIALVSYTITHHTRQSAVGLPFIREKVYQDRTCSVTEYTMSEIIASVYEKMERTGLKEGILFLDEINCVSETLAPTMLQFLQCKMFGNQKVPEGWIIVAAGNPPEYNKSVREFDIVTLDRLKRIDIEENYNVWREYAYEAGIDPVILAYLELRKSHFYRVENTVDGKQFVTARGWEDLSELLKVYRMLGKKADREVVHQYLQNWEVAKEFANYMELYEKYKKDYGLEKIVQGVYSKETLEKLRFASFDERFSIVGMLSGKLCEFFRAYCVEDEKTARLFGAHDSRNPGNRKNIALLHTALLNLFITFRRDPDLPLSRRLPACNGFIPDVHHYRIPFSVKMCKFHHFSPIFQIRSSDKCRPDNSDTVHPLPVWQSLLSSPDRLPALLAVPDQKSSVLRTSRSPEAP